MNPKKDSYFLAVQSSAVIRICAFLLLFVLEQAVYAQQTEQKNLIFFTQKDGLSSYNVHKIIQDNKRFIWIATQDGLNRFDGNKFTVYNKGMEHKKCLLSNDLRALIYDSITQMLWVICNQGGINGINILTGSVQYSIPYNNPYLEKEWRTGAVAMGKRIFIATSGGLEIFNTARLQFEDAGIYKSKELEKLKGDVRTIGADSLGNIWCGILNTGLIIYNPEKRTVVKSIAASGFQNKTGEFTFWPLCGVFAGIKKYYLGTKNGIFRIDFDNNYDVNISNSFSDWSQQEIADMKLSQVSQLLICANSLIRYNYVDGRSEIIKSINSSDQYLLNDMTTCYEDVQQNIWVGCRQGLALLKKSRSPFRPFVNSYLFNDLLSHVYAVCPVNKNEVLIGVKKGLLILKNESQLLQLSGTGMVQNVFPLLPNQFIISGNSELKLYTKHDVCALSKIYPEFMPFRNWQFNSAVTLNDSLVLIGTENNEGVLLWNYKRHRILHLNAEQTDSSLRIFSDNINSIFLTSQREAIVLSDAGLTVVSNTGQVAKKTSLVKPGTSQTLGILMDMAETSSYYWIAAYGEGLLKVDKKFNLIKIFDLQQGIGNLGIYKIFNCKDSILLMSSNNGITVFNTEKENFVHYHESDGLHNNTFEEACGSSYNGQLYVGGVSGFTIVDPNLLFHDNTTPLLYIEGVQVQRDYDKTIDTFNLNLENYAIPNDAQQTNIIFAGLYFDNPSRVVFQYKINNKNHDWISLGQQSFISFAGLKPGDYQLTIRSSADGNVWSEEKQITITQLPKWFETLYFKIGMILVALSIFFIVHRYRLSQIKARELIRKSIASDLHDDIGSTLNSVTIFTHLAETSIEKEEYFILIKDSLKQASAGLRDMIWVLDDNRDTISMMVERLMAFVLPVATASNISVVCNIEEDLKEQKLSKSEKRNILFVVKETINNSIKYSSCGKISIEFRKRESSRLSIIVKDNGIGFDMTLQSQGNGLRNMKVRAELINYNLRITSGKGRGTETELNSRN
jgi:ligand-binding sensor domain-containing protein